MRGLIRRLAEANRHAEIVAGLEQAISAGYGQPWMYEVLAISAEIVGRPKDEVERILLSGLDLQSQDPASLLYLAAHVARFRRYERARQLIEAAVSIEPAIPEAYELALRLARESNQFDWLQWTAPRLRLTARGAHRDSQIQAAEAAFVDVERELVRRGNLNDAVRFRAAAAESRRTDLSIRLDWTGVGDVDLAVHEPTGETCSSRHRRTRGGGWLQREGHGRQPDQCVEEYVCPLAYGGAYHIRVRWAWGDVVGKRVRVTIRSDRPDGTTDESTQIVVIGRDDVVMHFHLANGRRRTPESLSPSSSLARPKSPDVWRQLHGVQTSAQLAQGGAGGAGAAVGPGAIAVAPILGIIQEGLSIGAMAIVSGDRRFVRVGGDFQNNGPADFIPFTFTPGTP